MMILKVKKVKFFILALVLCGFVQTGWSRPLLTTDPATLGQFDFEAGMSASQRRDEFGFPLNRYETVNLPIFARFGVFDRLDLGFTLRHVSHRIETGDLILKGSANAQFSPEIKWGLNDRFALKAFWHIGKNSEDDPLPVERGDDFEIIAAWRAPWHSTWRWFIDVGYVFRDTYKTDFGTNNSISRKVDPGDIFELRTALEIPVRHHFNLLTELAYYSVQGLNVNGTISNSAGEALDVLTGLTWDYEDWNIGAGVAFGLLDESHTSFDLQRGAGDITGIVSIAYELSHHKLRRNQ